MVPALQSCVSQKSTVTGVPPRRRGQHFLVDAEVVHRIMEAAQIQPYESVLEIGPGKGALTRGLIERARSVLAVEIDGALFRKLEMEFTNSNNLRLLREDILHVSFSELVRWAGSPKLVVVGNLPYYIASPVVSKLVDNHMFVERAILMVQREVGRRITAAPGSKSYGMLSVMVQLRAEPRLLFDIPPNYFQPKPRVYSSLLRLSFRESLPVNIEDKRIFFSTVKSAFSTRRKMLKNSLRSLPGLTAESLQIVAAKAGIDLRRRAETLSLEEFAALSNAIAHLVSYPKR